jgi:hypothetical protein
VTGRVRVDAFAGQTRRAEGQDARARVSHVLHHDVEVHLLRHGRIRPGRRLVIRGKLEGQAG